MILFLGFERCDITNYFDKENIKYIFNNDKITSDYVINNNITIIISYRYRYIIKKDIINLNIIIINLHISLLPWNRGADPNLWSFLDNTKKGISIHYINEGIDTGDIIYQKEFYFDYNTETLSSTYIFLNNEIQQLFITNFYNIIKNNCPRIKQDINEGSYHKLKDKNNIIETLSKKFNNIYEIKIKDIILYLKS
jgi:methionyl-tRNA formyltransferase